MTLDIVKVKEEIREVLEAIYADFPWLLYDMANSFYARFDGAKDNEFVKEIFVNIQNPAFEKAVEEYDPECDDPSLSEVNIPRIGSSIINRSLIPQRMQNPFLIREEKEECEPWDKELENTTISIGLGIRSKDKNEKMNKIMQIKRKVFNFRYYLKNLTETSNEAKALKILLENIEIR